MPRSQESRRVRGNSSQEDLAIGGRTGCQFQDDILKHQKNCTLLQYGRRFQPTSHWGVTWNLLLMPLSS